MPATETLSIALPAEIATLVQQAVDAGEYTSQSEVVSDALRDWTCKRTHYQQLRNAWLEAVADVSDGEDPDPILDALERKYDTLSEASGR